MPAYQNTFFPSNNAVLSAPVVASLVITPEGLERVTQSTWGILAFQHDLETIHIQARLLAELRNMETATMRKIDEAYKKLVENGFADAAGALFIEDWQRRNGIQPNPWAMRGAIVPEETTNDPQLVPELASEPSPARPIINIVIPIDPIVEDSTSDPASMPRLTPIIPSPPAVGVNATLATPSNSGDTPLEAPPVYRRRERRATPTAPRSRQERGRVQPWERRCHLCERPGHVRRNCPRHRCMHCGERAPGHAESRCPQRNWQT